MLAVGFVSMSNAQGIKVGAKAGLNLSTVNGDDLDDAKSLIGFHLGAVAEISIADKFSFQPELLFSTQGAKAEGGDVDYSYEQKTKLNYLIIPLMAKFYLVKGLSVEAGPQVGFLMSAKAEGEETDSFGGVTETFEYDEDIKDDIKGTDIGINVGAGYKLDSGLFFNARYNIGLSNISEYDNGDIKNGVFQFSIGYFFL